MIKEVVLTPIAEEDFNNVVDYLAKVWGFKVTSNFIRRLEKIISLLAENSTLFPYVEINRNVQRCLVTKHNILYFIDTETQIKIITVFDTRQDPQKLSQLI